MYDNKLYPCSCAENSWYAGAGKSMIIQRDCNARGCPAFRNGAGAPASYFLPDSAPACSYKTAPVVLTIINKSSFNTPLTFVPLTGDTSKSFVLGGNMQVVVGLPGQVIPAGGWAIYYGGGAVPAFTTAQLLSHSSPAADIFYPPAAYYGAGTFMTRTKSTDLYNMSCVFSDAAAPTAF
jgi:hypothetical protein